MALTGPCSIWKCVACDNRWFTRDPKPAKAKTYCKRCGKPMTKLPPNFNIPDNAKLEE